MDETNEHILDVEFKRYLKIMQPYFGLLLDGTIVEVCNAWIKRLNNCKGNEKHLRNKYIFAMCYQLARGELEDPFLESPTVGHLQQLKDEVKSDESSSELEYLILDLENSHTEVLYDNDKSLCTTEILSTDSKFESNVNKVRVTSEDKYSINSTSYDVINPTYKQIVCYNCSNNIGVTDNQLCNESFRKRANNLIMKLREIKYQNLQLQEELHTLREQTKDIRLNETIFKIDNATSVSLLSRDSTSTLNSLKLRLLEVEKSKKSLVTMVSSLQSDINNINIPENIKTNRDVKKEKSIREEMKAYYENLINDLKIQHEQSLKESEKNYLSEKFKLISSHNDAIAEKDKVIFSKEIEIAELKKCIIDLNNKQNGNSSNAPDDDATSETIKQKIEELERRLNKIEKIKTKYCKDDKLARLEKEKHLNECSFHLQLVRQRAKVINELSNEYQTELSSSLNKLENRYKEIVANVQSTALQRRIHDQLALESIMQAVCGARYGGTYTNSAEATCPSQLTNKAMRNQTRDGRGNYDTEMPTVLPGNKVGSVIVANKSFGDESVVNDYCLDNQKFIRLFEKLYISQRDTASDTSKK